MMTKQKMTARLNVVLPKNLKDKLAKRAKTLGLDLSSYLRMIITKELKKSA